MTRRRILGAVLAGGAARRFGSDKALALLGGKPLWRHVADALAAETDDVIACGRPLGGLAWVADRPAPGLGPLGGIAAALAFAAERGFAGVVTAPCDAPLLPPGIVATLTDAGAACAADCPVVGWWPAALAPAIDAHLAGSEDRSLRSWIAAAGARVVDVGPIANVNRPGDLAGLEGDRRDRGG